MGAIGYLEHHGEGGSAPSKSDEERGVRVRGHLDNFCLGRDDGELKNLCWSRWVSSSARRDPSRAHDPLPDQVEEQEDL